MPQGKGMKIDPHEMDEENDPREGVKVPKEELEKGLSKFRSREEEYAYFGDAPLSPAFQLLKHKLATKNGKTPAYKGINLSLILQKGYPISDTSQDLEATEKGKKKKPVKAMPVHDAKTFNKHKVVKAMYTVRGAFYKKWFPCKIVNVTRKGIRIKWQDNDTKDTLKKPKHIKMLQ